MTEADEVLAFLRENLVMFREVYAVRRIGLFGSIVRGEATADSDIDLLVEFEYPSFANYMDLKFFVEDTTGKNVDLVIVGALKPRLKDRILREVQYVA